MKDLEQSLNMYFGEKAPQLPMGLKSFLVTIAPYLVILSVIFSVFGIFGALFISGVGFVLTAGLAGLSMINMLVSIAFSIASAVLMAMAIPGLFSKSMAGWRYVFYAQCVGIASSVVSLLLSLGIGSIAGFVMLVVFAAIGFYILFQVRPLYNGTAPVSTPTPTPTATPTPTV